MIFAVVLLASVLAAGCRSSQGSSLLRPIHGEVESIAVRDLGEGRVRLQRGTRQAVVDLSREISGFTGRLFDGPGGEWSGPNVSLEVLDEAQAGPALYVVLFASAESNCNIEGMCGAATDSTLIWLKLDESLEPTRQSFALEDCRTGIPRSSCPTRCDWLPGKDLPWTDDGLEVKYEEGFGASDPVKGRLVYDRKRPEAGLQISPTGAMTDS